MVSVEIYARMIRRLLDEFVEDIGRFSWMCLCSV